MTDPSNPAWEVEQKYIVPDFTLLESTLTDLGFRFLREEKHRDLYFRHPCRDFRKTDEAFRLRKVNDELCVTYKGKRLDSQVKTRPEIELELVANEFGQWKTLLIHLGFEPLPEVAKTRRVFGPKSNSAELADFVVTLDTVDQLGSFAEVELLIQSESALPAAQSRVESLATKLGLDQVQPLSYLAQLLMKLGLE